MFLDLTLFTDCPEDTAPNASIMATSADGYLTIVTRCFDLLKDEPKVHTRKLGSDALEHLRDIYGASTKQMHSKAS